jgi:uncharacterized protein
LGAEILNEGLNGRKKERGKMAQEKSNRGFGAMDDEKQREIASKGGHAAHQSGQAHEFDSEEARKAGQKGGESVSSDREHMSESGRKGGEHSHGGGSSQSSQSDERGESSGQRGGTSEQHAKAGSQSYKNR